MGRCNYIPDYGPDPFVVDIDRAAKMNNNFRTALWTGDHLQLTLIPFMHHHTIRKEQSIKQKLLQMFKTHNFNQLQSIKRPKYKNAMAFFMHQTQFNVSIINILWEIQ